MNSTPVKSTSSSNLIFPSLNRSNTSCRFHSSSNKSILTNSKITTYNADLIIAQILNRKFNFPLANSIVRCDKRIALEAVKKNGILLRNTCGFLNNDIDVVLIAVQNNGLALQFASLAFASKGWS